MRADGGWRRFTRWHQGGTQEQVGVLRRRGAEVKKSGAEGELGGGSVEDGAGEDGL